MKNFLFFLMLSISSFVFGKGHKRDSLERIAASGATDSIKIKAYFELGWASRQEDPDTCIYYFNKGIAFAKKIGKKKAVALGTKMIGIVYRGKNEPEIALKYLNEALKLYQEQKDMQGVSDCYNTIGNAYIILNIYDKALEYHNSALKIRLLRGDSVEIGASFANIGEIYRKLKDFKNSRSFTERSFKISEAVKDTVAMARMIGNLSLLYEDMNEFQTALDYCKKSITLCERIGDKGLLAGSYTNMARTLNSIRRSEEALVYLQKVMDIETEFGDKRGLAQTMGNIGKVYFDLHDLTQAEKYLLEANNRSKEMNIAELEETLSYYLFRIYKLKNDLAKAIPYIERSRALNDSLHNSGMEDALNKLKTQNALSNQEFELKAKERSNLDKIEAVNKEEQKRKNLLVAGIGLILLLVAIFSFFLYKRFKLIKAQKTEIEVQKHEVEHQKHIVDEKQTEIIASINYARRIQQAHLPTEKFIESKFKKMKRD